MKYTVVGCAAVVLLVGIIAFGWFSEGATVARRELGPSAMLRKYEEFKDISARLDAKAASIKAARSRLTRLEGQYAGVPRKDWPRHDADNHSVWVQEAAGMVASFNLLAADYNARMAKANYAFCNAGDLPKGADKPLPREFKPYMED